MRLLLVEDDLIIAQNLKTTLQRHALAVDLAHDSASGYQKCVDEQYDVLVLDRMLPDGDGLELCRRLRGEGVNIPIILLTAKSELTEVVSGLDQGADDYVTKPFLTEELLARIRTQIRRKAKTQIVMEVKVADLVINPNTHEVSRGGKNIELTPKEYSLLYYLASHRCVSVDRVTLLSRVWDEEANLFSNTLDVHIRYLRQKIDDQFGLKLIRTIRGKGYMLCDK